MNHRQQKAIWLMQQDERREIYEAGDRFGQSSGEYFVDYCNGDSPMLNRREVAEFEQWGHVVQKYPELKGLYARGPKFPKARPTDANR